MTEIKFDFKKVPLSVFLDSLVNPDDNRKTHKVISLALVSADDLYMVDMPRVVSGFIKAAKELSEDIAIAGGSMQKFFAED